VLIFVSNSVFIASNLVLFAVIKVAKAVSESVIAGIKPLINVL